MAPETPALGFHPGLDFSAGEATFQLASLIEISKTDDDALKQMLQEFLRSNRMDLELLSAYTLEDVQGVAQTAHKIKGGAKVLHAHRLISACEAVEHSSQLPAVNSGEVKNAVERLKQEMLCLEQDLVKTLARL
ncbi:Virulence sensor protein BvgS precursor [compost metagenome]